jgi:hypothetical protein
VDLIGWTGIVWAACSALFIGLERLAGSNSSGVWDRQDPWVSAVAYGLLFLFSPTVVAFGLFLGTWTALEWAYGRLFLGRTADPFSAPESEWPGDRGLFLGELIRRRKLHDPRLERDAIRNWPMFRFRSMPEAIVGRGQKPRHGFVCNRYR